MPSVDELERLSRYHAGELDAAERAAVEAELAQRADLREALEVLKSFDAAPQVLAPSLAGKALDELIAGVPRPAVEPPKRRWPSFAIAAALLVGLVAYATTRSRPSYAVALGSSVTVDGVALKPGEPRSVDGTARLKTAGAAAELIGAHGAWRIPDGAELSWGDSYGMLMAGTVVVSGDGTKLRAGSADLEIFGTAVASVEPENEVVRVNEALSTTTSEELVKKDWIKLPSLALAGGLTLFVLEGRAEAQTFSDKVTVRAGQKWQPGSAPTLLAAAPKSPGGQLAPPPHAGDPGASREQLLAEIEKLRDEKEALLKDREALKAQLAELKPKRNFYRLSKAELVELANKNEIEVRGNMMEDDDFKLNDETVKKLNLTAAERSKILAIMADATKRAHEGVMKQYIAMGGDANLASTLSVVSMVNEIRMKAVGDDYPDAIRQLANERAGLAPAADPNAGPVVLKTFRLLIAEDDRILDQLDALLGPSRAERMVNDETFGHSRHGYGVGPKSPKH
ncbi:MAG: hypothetical protein QM723_19495 [Myxococcaceae bacterium]